jgi:hypothetical protein
MRAFRLALLSLVTVLCFAAPAAADDPNGPIVILESPADGWGFYQGQQVQAGYACLAGPLGWPAIVCDGDVPLGAYIDTGSVGDHTFTVHAVDYAGAQTTVTHTYTVFDVISPTASISTPADGASYPRGAELYVRFSCDDGPGGSGIVGCIGTYLDGYPLPTDQLGTYTFQVDAYDGAMNHSQATVTYRIVDATPPEIQIDSPAEGAEFSLGEVVTSHYYCHDDVDGYRVSCAATSVDTSSYGPHTFRVDSVDSSGNASFATRTYTVVYDFEGFFSPLLAEPAVASARAGDVVPAKFSLHGNRGADVLVRAAWRPCSATTDDSSPATGSLGYSAGPDRYTFAWRTDKAWVGSCKELLLTLRDGTTHGAYVGFR